MTEQASKPEGVPSSRAVPRRFGHPALLLERFRRLESLEMAPEYLGLPLRERKILSLVVLTVALILALDLLVTKVYLWYILGEIVSMIIYGLVLPRDKQLSPKLALHHFPEGFMLFFAGYIVSVGAILFGLLIFLVVPLSYPAFLGILWVTTKVYRPQPMFQTMKDVLPFWAILLIGSGVGGLLH